MNSQYVLLAYVSSKQNIGVLPNGKALGLGACRQRGRPRGQKRAPREKQSHEKPCNHWENTLVNIDFFGCYPFQKNTDKMVWPQIWPLTEIDQKSNKNHTSGCGAVGSARRLGACDRLGVQPRLKTPKSLVNIDFSALSSKTKSPFKRGLTTGLTTYRIWPKIE